MVGRRCLLYGERACIGLRQPPALGQNGACRALSGPLQLFLQPLSWAGAWGIGGPAAEWEWCPHFPYLNRQREGLLLPRWASINEAIAVGKPTSPLAKQKPLRNLSTFAHVFAGQTGRQGWPGL